MKMARRKRDTVAERVRSQNQQDKEREADEQHALVQVAEHLAFVGVEDITPLWVDAKTIVLPRFLTSA